MRHFQEQSDRCLSSFKTSVNRFLRLKAVGAEAYLPPGGNPAGLPAPLGEAGRETEDGADSGGIENKTRGDSQSCRQM